MRRKNDRLKLVKKQNSRPVWGKITRFLFRLVLVFVFLFLLQQGETYFRIDKIKVQGADELQRGDIINAAEIREGMSIFLLRENEIAVRIKDRLPWVKKVKISRKLPDTVVVSIDERKPAAYVMAPDGFWLIDNQAVFLEHREHPTNGYPLVAGIDDTLAVPGSPIDCVERKEILQSFFLILPGKTGLEIDHLDLTESYNLIVYTTDGLEIWFGDGEDLDYKLKLIKESISYIDQASEAKLDVRCGKRLVVSGGAVKKDEEKGVDP